MAFTKTSALTEGGSGLGTVTSLTAGTGITLTPNPITQTGTIALYVAPTAPGVTLSSTPTGILREYGNTQTDIALSALTVKNTNNITSVLFKRGVTTIRTVPAPLAGGGTETWTDSSAPVDTATNYTCVVSDGTLTTTSNTVAFTFCYPIYYGVGADGLTGAQIRGLTNLIATPATRTLSFSPNANRVYYAYPSTSGALSQILDVNNFDVTADFTSTIVGITGLDTTTQNYRVYEIDHNVGDGSATTYRFVH